MFDETFGNLSNPGAAPGGKTLASNAESSGEIGGDIFSGPLINSGTYQNPNDKLIFVAGGLVALFLIIKLASRK